MNAALRNELAIIFVSVSGPCSPSVKNTKLIQSFNKCCGFYNTSSPPHLSQQN